MTKRTKFGLAVLLAALMTSALVLAGCDQPPSDNGSEDSNPTAPGNTPTTPGNPGAPTTPGNTPGTPASPVAVTGITLNKTSTTMLEGGTETLTALIAPANATNKGLTWSSNDTSVGPFQAA